MALTPEENQKLLDLRNEMIDLLTRLNQFARDVGADPIPLEAPAALPSFYLATLPPITPTPTPPGRE
jgi:hypothetical protein